MNNSCPNCSEESPDLDHKCILSLITTSDKVIRNGKVAVIYSWLNNYWSASIKNEECLFCPEIVNIILSEKNPYSPRSESSDYDQYRKEIGNQILKIANSKNWKFNKTLVGWAENLNIEWIPLGEEFWIVRGHGGCGERVIYKSKLQEESFFSSKA